MDNEELSNDLRRDWTNRIGCRNMMGEETSENLFKMLIRQYSESHRHYHNLEHVRDVLHELGSCNESLYISAWFHDAIYIPGCNESEELSASLARSCCLNLGFTSDFADKVTENILATKHDGNNFTDESRLLVDADLAIFASEHFDEYNLGIEKEYCGHMCRCGAGWEYSGCGVIVYYRGRIGVLESFLERDPIYRTEKFRKKYEKKAKENLKNEIGNLKENYQCLLELNHALS
ncbi:MAG: hypothetical protein ABIB71_05880 [Candidatus Woesearchaeota archaeon]